MNENNTSTNEIFNGNFILPPMLAVASVEGEVVGPVVDGNSLQSWRVGCCIL